MAERGNGLATALLTILAFYGWLFLVLELMWHGKWMTTALLFLVTIAICKVELYDAE